MLKLFIEISSSFQHLRKKEVIGSLYLQIFYRDNCNTDECLDEETEIE